MINLLVFILLWSEGYSFNVPIRHVPKRLHFHRCAAESLRQQRTLLPATSFKEQHSEVYTWLPQDLTQDIPGFLPIPNDDYVKKYQRNPELWPVEFFLITYRRIRKDNNKTQRTQVLVRKSANGTSKYGVGTGVPATRWLLSTQDPPRGYTVSEPLVTFDASNFPEHPKGSSEDWTYTKIEIKEDAFNSPHDSDVKDSELEEYARMIRDALKSQLDHETAKLESLRSSWEESQVSVVRNVLDKASSVAAIQGALRMSGLFECKEMSTNGSTVCSRYIELDENAPKPTTLAQSMRIYTMFPQMPNPMPPPWTSAQDLQQEIATRQERMAQSGRDPHQDAHGRTYTHISTSNVSNTIHGVYLTLDVTDMADLDEVNALDLFGTKRVKREWVSLEDLKVLASDGQSIGTEDPKSTFISGFIVRQLVKEGIIDTKGC
jgi:hypothetical protein